MSLCVAAPRSTLTPIVATKEAYRTPYPAGSFAHGARLAHCAAVSAAAILWHTRRGVTEILLK
jgi:hypothetical protein